MRRKACEVSDVGGIVGGQAKRANFVGKTKAPVMLHRARLRRVRLRIVGGAALGVDDERAHAARPQFIGEHEPARACADNQHVRFNATRHGFPRASA